MAWSIGDVAGQLGVWLVTVVRFGRGLFSWECGCSGRGVGCLVGGVASQLVVWSVR